MRDLNCHSRAKGESVAVPTRAECNEVVLPNDRSGEHSSLQCVKKMPMRVSNLVHFHRPSVGTKKEFSILYFTAEPLTIEMFQKRLQLARFGLNQEIKLAVED